ncbi:OprF membrane domain protein [Marinomonas spartinae]|uniref:OprF membrane domain protein n=1 Tax=Marinomonas spartinae TaxID=1792290 RepID=A0A1A8T175_9GAMM|nr:porin family protein [Marinomonas spartinae]SBS25680.1 OprF membrane domain protein [Marinomonas spartinae]
MSIALNKRTIFGSIILASSLSTLAYAQPQEGFTVTPSVGYMHTDTDLHLKDNASYSLGLGYQFNNPFGVEAVFLHSNQKPSGGGTHQDVDQYRLDGIYNLPTLQSVNLTPYVAAGVGSTKYGKHSDYDNVDVNAGGGVKYAVNKDLAVRADFRLVKDVDAGHLNNVTSVGVQYTFGAPVKPVTSGDSSSSSNTSY